MAPAGTLKPTLELRHQLNCSGIAIDAAAYDGRRHHLLTYGSHALKPHTLRLFSLRREIRSTPLFDDENKPPPPPPQPKGTKSTPKTQVVDPITTTALSYVSLVYAHELDVFICVFSAFHAPGGKKKARPDRTGYSVLFVEPGSLKKLVVYTGPQIHSLRCSLFDEMTGRLVLASAVSTRLSNSRESSRAIRVAPMTVDEERSNVVEILEISKRSFRRPVSALPGAQNIADRDGGPDRVMLSVEKVARATLWHSDPIECIAGAHHLKTLFGAGTCVFDDEYSSPGPQECVVLEWREQKGGNLALVRRIVHGGDIITCLATPPSGQWLVVGFLSGLLVVWSMEKESSGEDGSPRSVGPVGDGSYMHNSAIALLEVQSLQQQKAEAFMLYSTERASGVVKHWRFGVFASEDPQRVLFPRLDHFWSLSLDPHAHRVETSKKKTRNPGDWTHTIPMLVSVQKGNYSENLLVVTRGDTIHVIKIQPLVQVVNEVLQGEEFFALELYLRRDGLISFVSLSGSSSFHRLRISDTKSLMLKPSRNFVLVPPAPADSKVNVHITRLQVCVADRSEPWILCGWSSGVVEVYLDDGLTCGRTALLQDPHFDLEVTAINLVSMGKSAATSLSGSRPGNRDGRLGGLLRSTSHPEEDQGLELSNVWLVFAGASNGVIIGWRVSRNGRVATTVIYALEAFIRLDHPPPHSTHVVDLLSWADPATLMSVAADGMIKLWSIPSLQAVCHITTARTRVNGTHIGMLCTCAAVVGNSDVIVVGCGDGTLSAWKLQLTSKKYPAVEIPVSGEHGNGVSSINVVDNSTFFTTSLDMTLVLWAITDHVSELRFFDLGGPIVDSVFSNGIAIVALKSEICYFTLIESQSFESVVHEHSKTLSSVNEKTQPITADSSPTILCPEDFRPDHCSQPAPTPPTTPQGEEKFINIPDVVVPGSLSNMDSYVQLPRSGFVESVSGPLEGWLADQANEDQIETEGITLYMCQYISSYGTSGTIAAESLSHFMSMHNLPLCKRSRDDFAVRKYLHDNKLDPKTRLNAADAIKALLEMQRSAGLDQDNIGVRIKPKSNTSQFQRDAVARLAIPRKKRERAKMTKDSARRISTVSYNILGEKIVKWVESPHAQSNQEVDNDVTLSQASKDGNSGMVSQPRRRRMRLSVRDKLNPPSTRQRNLPDEDLLCRLHICRSFQPLWSNGYCWCLSPNVVVDWSPEGGCREKNDIQNCNFCQKHLHVINLQSKHYKPHFTSRMIMGIISEVYTRMMEPAHRLLYRNEKNLNPGEKLTIHATLWNLFQHKYGAQHVVELKIKQFFVSVCHFVREIDAVAVFGELLALFQRADVDEQVPHEMVAVCVTAYSWFFAREMIVNGDPILGSGDFGDQLRTFRSDSGKATNWQFVSLTNALFCAQELLAYPLVSPGYLRNILLFMEDYSQESATKPHQDHESKRLEGEQRWIEIHRFLRLLVGEWKQQTAEFRAVERTLFTEPLLALQHSAENEKVLASVLEKLRLILSYFVFCDHERVGLVELTDFESILRRLKYLWPNEHLSEQEAVGAKRYQDSLTFENTIIAARKRFSDVGGDGRLCYLDFWAMLYIVGVRTKSLLKFREIPSFCKDYKLEVSPELHNLLGVYMQRSSALLLPRGFHTNKRTIDETGHHQHQRRVGGLYDGTFLVDKPTVMRTLSMNELLNSEPVSAINSLYVDGSVPSLWQSASTTALDSYNSLSHGPRMKANAARLQEPVVVGVRSSGPRTKPVAFLSRAELSPGEPVFNGVACRDSCAKVLQLHSNTQEKCQPADSSPQISFGSVYVQFPDVAPRRTRIESNHLPNSEKKSISYSSTADEEAKVWSLRLIKEHEEEQRARVSLQEDRKRRATLAREQGAHVAAAAAADASIATHRRHHNHVSPRALPQSNASRSPKQTPLSPSNERSDTYNSSKHFGFGQPSLTPTSSEDPTIVIPSAETRIEVQPICASLDVKALSTETSGDSKELVSVLTDHQDDTMSKNTPYIDYDVLSVSEKGEAGGQKPQDITAEQHSLQKPKSISFAPQHEPIETARATAEPDSPLTGSSRKETRDCDEWTQPREQLRESSSFSDGKLFEDQMSTDEGNHGIQTAIFPNDTASEEKETAHVVDTAPYTASIDRKEKSSIHSVPDVIERQHPAPAELVKTTEHFSNPVTFEPRQDNQLELILSCNTTDLPLSALDSSILAPTKAEHIEAFEASSFVATTETLPASCEPTQPTPKLCDPRSASLQSNPLKATALSTNVELTSKARTSELRHRFKFSQQPKFKLSAAVLSNPFRLSRWKPEGDSDSDGNDSGGSSGPHDDDDDAYDDDVAVEDTKLRLSRDSIASLSRQFGRKTSTAKAAGLSTFALTPSNKNGSVGLGSDGVSEVNRGHRVGKDIVRLDEDAERALYGGRVKGYLGEGIGFSADAEEYMKHKWADFFGNAELSMFSPLKEALKDHEEAQRHEEELQGQLMKKRQDQQQVDTLRMQRSSIVLQDQDRKADPTKQEISFRERRMTREACSQIQQEIKLGEIASGKINSVGGVQYFHFEYKRDSNDCSILTVKLHVTEGEADLFLSTETLAPCSSDFQWRSVEKYAIPEAQPTNPEGKKVVLFPHDLARVVGISSSTVFYMSVVAIVANTAFTLGVMTSGQKSEPSRAIQAVDSLISHFNQLAKTYEGQASQRTNLALASTMSYPKCAPPESRGFSSVDRLREFLVSATSSLESVEEDENINRPEGLCAASDLIYRQNDTGDAGDRKHLSMSLESRRLVADPTEDREVQDQCFLDGSGETSSSESSFQQLLESFGRKHGHIVREASSFVMHGMIADQRELAENEEDSLIETRTRYFHTKKHHSLHGGLAALDDGTPCNVGQEDAIAVATKRRIFTGLPVSLSERVGTKSKQKLSPLKSSITEGRKQIGDASLRIARYEPKLVAYSLSSLHSVKQQSSLLTMRRHSKGKN